MKNITKEKVNKRKGSLTVEASLVLPIFICILTGTFLILKMFYIGSIVQESLDKTTKEIAVYSYGKALVETAVPIINKDLSSSQDIFSVQNLAAFNGNFKALIEIVKNPESLLEKNIAISKAKSNLFTNKNRGILKELGVDESDKAIDFSDSEVLLDGKNILISVKYKVKINIPPFFNYEIPVEQKSFCRSWLGGDGKSVEKNVENIWDLKPMERGKKLQKLLGRNMEKSNFKTITSYNKYSGEATSIKSIDLSAKSYQSTNGLTKAVERMLQELSDFQGTVRIEGDNQNYSIKSKRLLIVVPKDCRNDNNQKVFDSLKAKADHMGINMEVLNYGNKKG